MRSIIAGTSLHVKHDIMSIMYRESRVQLGVACKHLIRFSYGHDESVHKTNLLRMRQLRCSLLVYHQQFSIDNGSKYTQA